MSGYQFDDLLLDFGESTTTTTTVTTKTSSHGAFDDDFDPFGPSSDTAQTSNGGGSGILFDLSTDTEIKNGEISGGADLQSSKSPNPFIDMSTSAQQPSNPLYDLDADVSNPLYNFSEADTNESSNPLYEFTTQTTTKSDSPSNPLYDTYDNDDEAIDEAAEEVDLLSGTNEQPVEDEEYQESAKAPYGEEDFDEVQEVPEERQIVHEVHETLVLNGEAHHWIGVPYEPERREEEDEAEQEPEEYEHDEHDHEELEHEEEDDGSGHHEQVEIVEEEDEIVEDGRTVSRTRRTENRYSGSGLDSSQTSEDFSSNHWDDERNRQNVGYDRQTEEQDIIQFSEISATKTRFEAEPKPAPRKQVDIQKEVLSAEGGVYESQPQTFQQWQNEEQEDGVYENQPLRRDDVVREADTDKIADLPPVGTAQSLRAKFMSAQQDSTKYTPPQYDHTPRNKHVSSPHGAGSEHASEPRSHVEKYEPKVDSGVFESEPVHNPDVVRSGEEVKEELPERGMAKNLANMFRQISSEQTHSSSSSTRAKKEITLERSSRLEHVNEPASHHVNEYEIKVDAGVFENQPQRHADVVTSDSVPEEYVPERGFAKNVAAKFKVLESTVKSPPLSPGRRKEFTPPRDEDRFHQAVVVENTPDLKSDIVHSTDQLEETLPEKGMARHIAQLFRQMEAENKTPSSPKAKKEFTPPPRDAGVYENQPKQFHAEYNRPAESGVIENEPVRRENVVRSDEPPRYEEELPERGAARNLVNKWRQMESESVKLKSPGSSGRPKDFTPSRDDPRAGQHKKSPRTPMSPSGHGQLDNGSVHPSDLPGQYQPQTEANVFESSPQRRSSDVLRESDGDSPEGLPKKDTAKKMLARFQSIQAEASKQTGTPVTRKDSESSETEIYEMMENEKQNCDDDDDNKVGRSKSMRAAIQTEKCGACEKTVYAMERLEMNKRVYHKACFRCTQCKAVLTPKTFAINNDVIFCTTHYKQLFATKGNYDEGFGRMQHKKRWSSNPNLAKDDEEDGKS